MATIYDVAKRSGVSIATVSAVLNRTAYVRPELTQRVKQAEDVFRKKGYLLILGHTYNRVEEQSRYLSAFRSRLVDGILLFQAPGEDSELDRVLKTNKPVVFVGRIPEGVSADIVATDILYGTQMAVGHLLQQGHTKIG